MKKVSLILFLMVYYANIFAQLSTNEQPVSFQLGNSKSLMATVTMPYLDMEKIEKEDKENEENNRPPRFGYLHKVNYNLYNSGTWRELSNGDKLWQLNVICPDALSIQFLYDKFWLPEGGKFFIYSADRKHSIGAFTSRNNKGDNINPRGFATELVSGSDVILEYYQPKEVSSNAIISIEYVVHGYRHINIGNRASGSSGTCRVNINCPEGQNWQNEKKAVAMILNYGGHTTGSLINATNLNQVPFFLAANHPMPPNHDAAGNTNLDQLLFYWNYEAAGCDSDSDVLTSYTTSGATLLANNPLSDFALFRLTEDPQSLPNYTPYYMGWDRSGLSGNPGVNIHHPLGDVKKISTIASQPVSSYWPLDQTHTYTYWMVTYQQTPSGYDVPDHGSSGSPLLNAAHKVIGQLLGGTTSNCTYTNGNGWYGKFDVSWTGNGNDSISRRLNCWLDSLNTGVQTLEGLLVIPSDSTLSINQQLYSNIRITSNSHFTIQSDVELMGNSCVIVETGGELIVDGGTLSNVDLVLKAGASLRIINGGVIETRNGFIAPIGAIVNIVEGKIT